MNRTEVAELLTFIEGIERRSFPDSAVDAWLAILAPVEAEDVMRAAIEAFDQPEPVKGGVQPGALRRRASQIRATRKGGALKELEAARARAVPPNDEYLNFRRKLAARLGERGGDPVRVLDASAA